MIRKILNVVPFRRLQHVRYVNTQQAASSSEAGPDVNDNFELKVHVYQELLRNHGISMYDLLKVDKHASADDIDKSYQTLMQTLEDDRSKAEVTVAW